MYVSPCGTLHTHLQRVGKDVRQRQNKPNKACCNGYQRKGIDQGSSSWICGSHRGHWVKHIGLRVLRRHSIVHQRCCTSQYGGIPHEKHDEWDGGANDDGGPDFHHIALRWC